jgi:AcrR family transcriptional regulator
MSSTASVSYHHGNLEKVILDLGFASARKNGIAGIGLRKLAAQAGVTPGAIYRHFSNSEVIKAEISKLASETLAKKMLTGLEGLSDPKLRFRSLIESYLDFAFTEKNLFEISTAACSEPPKTPDENSVWKIVIAAIEDLSLSGNLKTGTVASTGDFVWASAQGYATLVNQNEDLVSLTKEQFIEHLITAVIA